MKEVNLNHRSRVAALKEMKKHGKDCVLDSRDGVYFINCRCDDKKVTVKDFDSDGSNHITQDEVVKQVQKVAPTKSRKEIISDIDTNENGRITKKEVRDWIKKEEK